MKRVILLIVSILFFSCKKELNINQFSEDFQYYESELRIEGLILPNYETAIVRIDRSFPLFDTDLYDCRDNDYGVISEDSCFTLNGTWHGIAGSGELADCGDWDKNFDDIGEDAKPLDPSDDDNDNNVDELSIGEGNKIPDCGEPNVDEINEVISKVHINQGCIVKVKHNNEECQLFYSDNADSFFTEKKYIPSSPIAGKVLDDIDIDYYGAYIPKNCNNFNWSDYEGEYSFFCDCTEAGYGVIQSKETIRLPHPVVFIKVEDSTNIKHCMDYDCLLMNSTIASENIDSLHFGMNTLNQHIYYTTLKEDVTDFEHVQYMLNEDRNKYIYYHGHKARTTPSNIFNSNVLINREKIITRLYDGKGNGEYDLGEIFADTNNSDEWDIGEGFRDGPDGTGDVNRFVYEIISFSKSYRDYYFLSELDLSDPVRSNLRDSDNNSIMGSFGALATNKIYFRLVDCSALLNEFDCINNTGNVCVWDTPNLKCKNNGI